MKKPRNRAAQDATLINIRRLQRQVVSLQLNQAALNLRLAALEKKAR